MNKQAGKCCFPVLEALFCRASYAAAYCAVLAGLLLACFGLLPSAAHAGEGMWTFDNPPSQLLKEKFGFTPGQAWLDHLRLASVRFMNGGSGSFVSPHGLVVTNHHVAVGQLQKMSSEKKDYVKDGFYAVELKDEIPCVALELNVLVAMEEVTQQVMAGVDKGMDRVKAVDARKAARARIEKEAKDKTGLECEVVSLYHGGEYWLYRYKKYTDVRLVMAPEKQAAFFGGDSDNFTYPRYDLDMAFFRVYEDGKPLKVEHFLKWSKAGADKDELVFITGHPGTTDRLDTLVQLEVQRDVSYPFMIQYMDRMLEALKAYASTGDEQNRRSKTERFGYANGRKAYGGMFKSLNDEGFMARRKKAEQEFRQRVTGKVEWQKAYGGAWEDLERVYVRHADELKQRTRQALWGSRLAGHAITIVKLVHELKKPDGERLDGFHDSEIERLKFRLFSAAPLYSDLEAVKLQMAIVFSLDGLKATDSFAKILRNLGDPKMAAEKLCGQSKLLDPAFRKQLVEGGVAAVEKSTDPLIVLARKLVPIMVANEIWRKKTFESVTIPAKEQIAQARFAIYGKGAYPDATFSLRLTFGTLRGYPMNGTRAPYMTTLYGLYDRALGFGDQADWALPKRYWDRRKYLELATPVNFVCDCDITGGNSGSPVINKAGELVGVVFDGNIESLAGRFFFDDMDNRAVVVHSAYVIEALRKLYDAEDLADEIQNN
ncbi:MAG: S46 family peptidase [Deltaproteobacteria bacterium]|nr:S46 family peptidase [Deltaproteobacteria bacterium]